MQNLKKLKTAISIFFCTALIALGVLSGITAKTANALTSTSGAVKAGEGAELWNDGDFNGEVVGDVMEKLFGDDDPMEYVKSMKDEPTDSYVIPASAINARVGTDNGLVVTLGGMEWMAASLTVAELNGEENIVLTLYLADDNGESIFYSDNTNTKGSNMYSRSVIRNTLLTNSTWGLFQDAGENSFARQFLVQPKNIKYQQTESMVGRYGGFYNSPNDALGTLSGGWYGSMSYQPADTFDGKRYDDWGNDYIWLPSLTETGSSNIADTTSIWKLNNAQRNHSSVSYSWLRSGNFNHYYRVYTLFGASRYPDRSVDSSNGIRPALHLNLSEAAKYALRSVNPADVEKEYNGEAQTAESAAWYNSERVTLSYLKDGATVTPTDVGTYDLKVTLKDNTAYKFKNDEAATALGYKIFKFTINPKKVAVKFNYDSDGLPSVDWAESLYARDDTDARRPTLALTYKNASSGETFDDFPTKLGTYTASAYLKNKGCGNYEIDTAKSTTSNSFTVTARKITEPVLESGGTAKTVQYTGSSQSIKIQNISDDVTVKLGDGLTDEGTDSNGILIVSATDVGEFTVTVSLNDGGLATVWSGGGTASKQFTLTITQASITATISGLPEKWQQGRGQSLTVTPSGLIGSDTVEFYVYYKGTAGEVRLYESGGAYSIPSDLAIGTYTFGVRLTSTDGNYKMTEKLQNFEVTTPGAEFTEEDVQWQYTVGGGNPHYITGGNSAAEAVELEYAGSAYVFNLSLDADALAAKGVKAVYSGDTDATNYKSTAYSVTVTLSAKDSSVAFTTTSYTVYFKINKAKFDLSGIKWNYDPNIPLQYTGKTQSVAIDESTLPEGFTASYSGDSKKIPVGTYHTSVSFDIQSGLLANYVAPDKSDATTYKGDFNWEIEWQIAKKEINVSWQLAEYGEGDEIFKVPQLAEGGDLVDYTFYKKVDGEWEEIDFPEYSNGIVVQYKVTAALSGTNGNIYVLVGNAEREFVIGEDKYPVTVQVKVNNKVLSDGAQFAYTGKPFAATVTVLDGYVSADSVILTYYKDGVQLSSPPSEAGVYELRLALKEEDSADFYIQGEYRFTFEILEKPADGSDDVIIPTVDMKNMPAPAIGKKAYTGKPIDVWAEIRKDYGDYIIASGDTVAIDVGNYSVTFTLNTEEYPEAAWADGVSVDGNTVTVSWSIDKAIISGNWGPDGKLELDDIEGIEKLPDDLFDYKYYDKDGNEIAPEDRVSGENYTVEASLNDKYKDNFSLDDGLAGLISQPHEFTYEEEPVNGSGCNAQPNPLLWISIALIVIDLVIFILTMRVLSKSAEADEQTDEDDEDDGDNEEDD